ncbi:MAG: 3'(2'),5'-bisphosphate nucleotidase CysQ [Nonlabens sp.]
MISNLGELAIKASIKAGAAIMEVYNKNEAIVDKKADDSPLTQADLNSNAVIIDYLKSTDIPVISEEIKNSDYLARKDWEKCWIVDPMDGTKEFVNRNGEFTVNIALLENGKLTMGVIYAPVLKSLYFTSEGMADAFRATVDWEKGMSVSEIVKEASVLKQHSDKNYLKVVASKSHLNQETKDYIDQLSRSDDRELQIVSVGSSLKFCLVAEGTAEVYPRFGPTMEWDTAAGQAICEAAGVSVTSYKNNLPLQYNKEDLYNPFFIVN